MEQGIPLIERVVSVAGDGIKRPANLLVRIGTPISSLIDQCGGFTDESVRVIAGGPMMGFEVESLFVPVIKTTSGIVVLKKSSRIGQAEVCFRCGRCVEVCPMGLFPGQLATLTEKENYAEAKDRNLFDCLECGCCVYNCPSKRPLVQRIRSAKSKIKP
jgi:Na+-translocating ferredoxin:NAD+ oxidoreductase subunit C